MGLITVGLAEVRIGKAAPNGVMPTGMTKIGKVYKDSCKISQEASEVTEHFEEGHAAPVYSKRTKKIPKSTFQLCDADPKALARFVGGKETSGVWEFNGNELTEDAAIEIEPEQGMIIQMPNASIEAVINSDMSSKGIFLVDLTITPLAVDAGGAIRAKKKA